MTRITSSLKVMSIATALLFAGAPASGSTLLAHDLESLSTLSDHICTARVVDATSFMKGGRIYTLSRVEIIESVKGADRQGNLLEVVTAGGHSEWFSQKVFGAAELEVGAEYLLFLEHRGSVDISHPVGMTQGALPVSIQADTADRQVSPPKSIPNLMRKSLEDGSLHPAALWINQPERLSDVLTRIRGFIGGEK